MKADAASVVVVLSPFLTVEEAFQWATAAKSWDKGVRLALGPVPMVGVDDSYPKDVKGNPVAPAKFVIRAEKCPNRLGVEMVLQHFQGGVTPFAGIGATTAVVFVGGYPEPVTAEALTGVVLPDLLVVQDLFTSPLAKAAKYLLPGTSNFEKDGTFLNHAGYAQTFARAANPPKEVRSELQVACDLAGKRGLAQASAVRKELAKTFPALAALAEPKAAAKGAARLELQTV